MAEKALEPEEISLDPGKSEEHNVKKVLKTMELLGRRQKVFLVYGPEPLRSQVLERVRAALALQSRGDQCTSTRRRE